MDASKTTVLGWVRQFAAGRRFPTVFLITGALFLLDVLIPDLIPFVDEILLGLMTVLLGSLRQRKESRGAEEQPPTIDV